MVMGYTAEARRRYGVGPCVGESDKSAVSLGFFLVLAESKRLRIGEAAMAGKAGSPKKRGTALSGG